MFAFPAACRRSFPARAHFRCLVGTCLSACSILPMNVFAGGNNAAGLDQVIASVEVGDETAGFAHQRDPRRHVPHSERPRSQYASKRPAATRSARHRKSFAPKLFSSWGQLRKRSPIAPDYELARPVSRGVPSFAPCHLVLLVRGAFGARSTISRHSAARSLHSRDVLIGYPPTD